MNSGRVLKMGYRWEEKWVINTGLLGERKRADTEKIENRTKERRVREKLL